jgi:hypothetical protein
MNDDAPSYHQGGWKFLETSAEVPYGDLEGNFRLENFRALASGAALGAETKG